MPTRSQVSMPRFATLMRWILLLWFVAVSLMVFIPSLQILYFASGSGADPTFDIEIPKPPPYTEGKLDKGVAEAHAKWLDAYVKYIAEASRIEAEAIHTRVEAYELVVKDTLSAFAATFITLLLGYAFVNTAGQVAERAIQPQAQRSDRPSTPIAPL